MIESVCPVPDKHCKNASWTRQQGLLLRVCLQVSGPWQVPGFAGVHDNHYDVDGHALRVSLLSLEVMVCMWGSMVTSHSAAA